MSRKVNKYREAGKLIDYRSTTNRMITQLAERGLSVACITEKVNSRLGGYTITEAQVYYRMRQSGNTLRNYRNGESDFAKTEIERVCVKVFKVRKAS